MSVVRLGAVGYLNARPLVHGLERDPRVRLRFDAPSVCAALLHAGEIDLGLIPSIEYLRGPAYDVVPGIAIASDGPVASVALFSAAPPERIRSIAVDTSSRTSAALLAVLCAHRFGIAPRLEPAPPDPDAMLARHDAALLIGDAALFLDHEARGLVKIDLGEAWTAMTGLPFVWAFWAGRPGAGDDRVGEALRRARDAGVAARDEIADAYGGGDARRAARARAYLRDNVRFDLGAREIDGLRRFWALAVEAGLAPAGRDLRFCGAGQGIAAPRGIR